MRGLKHGSRGIILLRHKVAPYVGAWIETSIGVDSPPRCRVAPYVGAWIETIKKQESVARAQVAPYVGAWIETPLGKHRVTQWSSHPTWVRGLKLSFL